MQSESDILDSLERSADHLIESVRAASIPGAFAEFGVGSGCSTRKIAAEIAPRVLYGFDWFHGLPQAWHLSDSVSLPPGEFGRGGERPQLPENVKVYAGLFAATLPIFLAEVPENITFLHIDCDLYESARQVLFGLDSRIVPGTVIRFDEIGNFSGRYPNWREGEWKALVEWCATGREVEFLSNDSHMAATLRVVR